MENRPRILFFGFSDVGYRCLKLLLDKGCDVIGVFTHTPTRTRPIGSKRPKASQKKTSYAYSSPTR